MEVLPGGEEASMKCPYNDCHYIRIKRMERHLVLCRKNYPNKKLVRCDFNTTHEVPEPELQYHYEVCSDKKKIELCVYKEKITTEDSDPADLYPIKAIEVPIDDSWEDCSTSTYNPREYCENNPVLVRLDVQPPSKKKVFRLEQRSKMMALQQPNESPNASVESAPNENRNVENLFSELTMVTTEQEAEQLRGAKNMMEKLTKGSKKLFVAKNE